MTCFIVTGTDSQDVNVMFYHHITARMSMLVCFMAIDSDSQDMFYRHRQNSQDVSDVMFYGHRH